MREILFRGLRTDGKGWVEGNLLKYIDSCYIVPQEATNTEFSSLYWKTIKNNFRVIRDSVSQFTGLTDKNGTKIFEGDVFDGDEEGDYYTVIWNEDECRFQLDLYGYNLCTGENSQEIYSYSKECIDANCFDISALSGDVIIGNIHENK